MRSRRAIPATPTGFNHKEHKVILRRIPSNGTDGNPFPFAAQPSASPLARPNQYPMPTAGIALDGTDTITYNSVVKRREQHTDSQSKISPAYTRGFPYAMTF